VLRVDRAGGNVEGEGRRWRVHPVAAGEQVLRLEIDGAAHRFFVERAARAITVGHRGQAHVFRRPEQFLHDATAAASDGAVLAPMPGTILSVTAEVGRPVRTGDTLVVMEAMKMEIALQAPFDGSLEALDAAEGEQVPLGHELFRVAPDDAER
jgi:acetyl-CoA/propionyl-CoA carboxylase biotin carboxyl carrier protein